MERGLLEVLVVSPLRSGLVVLLLAAIPARVGAQVTVTTPLPGVRMAHMVNGGRPTALLVIDLCAPGIQIRTTRYEERGQLASTWAAGTGVDLAINGDLFVGGYATMHWSRSGGADWPAGTHDMEPHPNIAFGPGLAMRGDLPPSAAATDIVGGIPEIVIGGETNPHLPDTDFVHGAHRRTAVGLSADRRTLYLYSSDGTSSIPGVHFGMAVLAGSVPGAPPIDWALNFDGGGSSQMWVRGVGTVIPSSRNVSNHLGVFARGSGPSPLCPTPDPRCPPTGTVNVCLDGTVVGTCVNGILASSGDCAAFGVVCHEGMCVPPPPPAPDAGSAPMGSLDAGSGSSDEFAADAHVVRSDAGLIEIGRDVGPGTPGRATSLAMAGGCSCASAGTQRATGALLPIAAVALFVLVTVRPRQRDRDRYRA